MKNKHLVLIFLMTLLIGLAIRRAPWKSAIFFQTNLLKLDTAEIQQIQILLPDKSAVLLLRGDAGWSAEALNRSVIAPAEILQEMLASLADMQSIRIVKTQTPDSLGFRPTTNIQLDLILADARRERLNIGLERLENGQLSTFVQLPRHQGVYLVNKPLRKLFSKKFIDFRQQTIARFLPEAVRSFCIKRANADSLFFTKNDSTGVWDNGQADGHLTETAVQSWLSHINGLQQLAFADLFDDSHANDSRVAQILIRFRDPREILRMDFFKLKQLNVPEELPHETPDRRELAPFVLHSSQNPTNYFAFPDTLLLRQICYPF